VVSLFLGCLKCGYGYSSKALPPGTYSRHCGPCCYNHATKHLTCGACRCSSTYTRSGKRCKGPWRFRLPRGCKGVTYLPHSNRMACVARKNGESGSSYGR
jgi:hypothetical protein